MQFEDPPKSLELTINKVDSQPVSPIIKQPINNSNNNNNLEEQHTDSIGFSSPFTTSTISLSSSIAGSVNNTPNLLSELSVDKKKGIYSTYLDLDYYNNIYLKNKNQSKNNIINNINPILSQQQNNFSLDSHQPQTHPQLQDNIPYHKRKHHIVNNCNNNNSINSLNKLDSGNTQQDNFLTLSQNQLFYQTFGGGSNQHYFYDRPSLIYKLPNHHLSSSTSSLSSTSSTSSSSPNSLFSSSIDLFYSCIDKKKILSLFLTFPQTIGTDSFVLKEYERLKMLQEQQGPRHTEILLRKEDNVGGRKALKEKFVEIYESFFNGEDPSEGQPIFWEQLFLIKVNIPFLERCIILTSEDHLLALKPNINKIFTQCCHWLKDPNPLRLAHIIETLSILLKSIFRKKFNNFGFDILNILCGIENSDQVFTDLIRDLENLLKNPTDKKTKVGIINLLTIIATATEYINQNTLLQYFMSVDIFDTLIGLIDDQDLEASTQMNVLTLLCYLCNYQKYETPNPYLKDLSNLSDTQKVTCGIHHHNEFFEQQYRDPNLGMMSKFSGYLSSWVYSPKVVKPCTFFETVSCLLVLYELFYQSEHFINLLVKGGLPSNNNSTCPNIIKEFFTFCAYLASDAQKEVKVIYSKICLLILLLISEKNELEEFFHDIKSTCYIFIYSKKTLFQDPKETEKYPLSYFALDIISHFIKCNLKGKISMEIHQTAVDAIHRIISYKKKTQNRLPYKWNDLWSTLFSIINLIVSNNDKSQLNQSIQVGLSAINVFNLFINYGDSFLPSPNDYDELFYEIIRSGQSIDKLYQFIQDNSPSHSTSTPQSPIQQSTTVPPQSPVPESNNPLLNPLLNIRSIVQHFTSKLQLWSTENPEVALTAPQVSKIIKDNYDTLRLKLQENLDQYEPYVENPKEILLFRHIVKELIGDVKKQINVINL
ncbi:hypothetical protein DICPUDRAFT_153625 [Dictyostelium purpureum]|uniref:Armadillo-like helical domain-containing protein n=1 Tax=Dictyostelium purpureum TaxID=5786 RepID=F0ZPC9_DICPU|nr:uncharacterized protein DICPUDRAFT_153625 [Dictyostelium purpureum]EGC34221.1 hypothetical protein DICPUDRAFT_153625 [Dictyostelium purpureum]|eukprot:XP_003289273.1 hypothetical protein DICPUDRAFT_153625 [Dictyostelium purpureum]